MKLARLLAREVAYRSRKTGYRHFTLLGSSKEVREPSALSANIIGIALFSFISIVMVIPFFMKIPECVGTADILFVSVVSLLLLLEAFMALLNTATFTSTFISEKLVEPLRILPIGEERIMRAYFEALILYWGGLSVIFIVLPGMLLLLLASPGGVISPIQPLAGIIAGVLVLLCGSLLGIGIGTYAPLVRKHVLFRSLSTMAWLLAFIVFYASSSLIRYGIHQLATGDTSWIAILPFVGVLLINSQPLLSALSIPISLALLLLIYKFSIGRLRLLLMLEPRVTMRKPFKIERRIPERLEIKIVSRSPVIGFIVKDLRLLSREPRRLATVLYTIAIPFLMLLPSMASGRPPEDPLIESLFVLMPSVILGLITGTVVNVLFYVEGSGAKVLYFAPISRRKLALLKTLGSLVFSTSAATIMAAIILYSTRSPLLSLTALIVSLGTALSASLFQSAIVVKQLPPQPSEWSEISVSRLVHVVSILLLFILLMGFSLIALFVLKDLVKASILILATYMLIGTSVFITLAREEPL
ncbi:MAG: hypothetical protein DRJ59_07770 [Thermoprotei archaeon]|nr:MAG: hypothetical protein DRJ59_07770 [Thermoprotei archaeon]